MTTLGFDPDGMDGFVSAAQPLTFWSSGAAGACDHSSLWAATLPRTLILSGAACALVGYSMAEHLYQQFFAEDGSIASAIASFDRTFNEATPTICSVAEAGQELAQTCTEAPLEESGLLNSMRSACGNLGPA